MQVINNLDQLAKILERKITAILELVVKDVKNEIDETLNEYCEEYSPIYYHRTDQLRNCCKIGSPKINNGEISINVYLDIDSLKYKTRGADSYKTVVAADAGLHGGWSVDDLSKGQVPWTDVGGNIGEKIGSGVQIWEEPMEEIIDNGKLISMFKKHAKERGLYLKEI